MKIEILAPFKGAISSGLYGKPSEENPSGELKIGEIIEVTKEPIDWAGRYRVVDGSTEKTALTNPASGGVQQTVGYAVKEKSPGWFVITKDGEPVSKSLRKDDVEGFESLSDEDKAAFAELHKPE